MWYDMCNQNKTAAVCFFTRMIQNLPLQNTVMLPRLKMYTFEYTVSLVHADVLAQEYSGRFYSACGY